MSFDQELFGNKKFSDLLKDIYDNQKKKERQLNLLIADLKPLITNISDAGMLVPSIKDLMEVSVKNDEHLLKMATIIQRIFNNQGDGGGDGLSITEAEREELMAQLDQLQKPLDDK